MQYRVVQQVDAGPNECWLICVGDSVLARFTSRDTACSAARSLAILDCVSGRPAEVLFCPLGADPRVLWACPAESEA